MGRNRSSPLLKKGENNLKPGLFAGDVSGRFGGLKHCNQIITCKLIKLIRHISLQQ
jgi:hypothetical protein